MMYKVLPLLLLVFAVCVAPGTAGDSAGVVNINTATSEQLQLLPRVGPALSGRIIDFRKANGAFEKVDELVAVKGIGEKAMEKLEPYVVTKGETTLVDKVRLPRQQREATTS